MTEPGGIGIVSDDPLSAWRIDLNFSRSIRGALRDPDTVERLFARPGVGACRLEVSVEVSS